jgi:hypothetical protein
MNFKELIEKIYKSDFNVNKYSLSIDEINTICQITNKQECVKYIFENYDSRFSEALLLTCPCLWINFKIDDWKLISISISPRRKLNSEITLHINDNVGYSDLIFLRRYFNLKIEDFIDSSASTFNDDKEQISEFTSFYEAVIFRDKNEIANDLNDFYNITIKQLSDYIDYMKIK